MGGLLAIHDVFPDPADGGRPPYEEIFLPALESGRFTLVSAAGSLRVRAGWMAARAQSSTVPPSAGTNRPLAGEVPLMASAARMTAAAVYAVRSPSGKWIRSG